MGKMLARCVYVYWASKCSAKTTSCWGHPDVVKKKNLYIGQVQNQVDTNSPCTLYPSFLPSSFFFICEEKKIGFAFGVYIYIIFLCFSFELTHSHCWLSVGSWAGLSPATTLSPAFKTTHSPCSVFHFPGPAPIPSNPQYSQYSQLHGPQSTRHTANGRKCHFGFLHCACVFKSHSHVGAHVCERVCVSL